MKKILVLVDNLNDRHKFISKFVSENLGLENEVVLKHFEEINFFIERNNLEAFCGDTPLSSFDLVYLRRGGRRYIQLEGTIALFLKSKNIKYVDVAFGELGAAGNKLYNISKLALGGIPVVPSLYISREKIDKFLSKIAKRFEFPVFVKSLVSQRREGIFVVEKEKDFAKVLKNDSSEGFLIQPKIDIEQEYRLVVMGEKVVAAHKEEQRRIKDNRIQVDSTESGLGWFNPETLPEEVLATTSQGSKALGLNISGADVARQKGTGRYFVFEINRGPGFTIDPKVSPELPELAKYFKSLISK